MNRQEQLLYCKACSHQKFDASKGIICGLTDDQAEFVETCTNYNEDPDLKHKMEMDKIRQQMNNQEASKGIRFANYLIDLVVLQVMSFFVGVLLAIILMAAAPDSFYLFEESWFTWFLYLFIGMFYFTLFEATTGRTLGKIITGTKVVDEGGNKIGINTALVRSISRFVPFDSLSFLGENGWHDKWSNTRVVKINKR